MSAVFDASSGTVASKTLSHTCSGSNRLLIVFFVGDTSDTVTSITYNGVAMTQWDKWQPANGWQWVYIYYLVNPATGTNTIQVNGPSTYYDLCAVSYTGVNQTTPVSGTAWHYLASGRESSASYFFNPTVSGCLQVIGYLGLSGVSFTGATKRTTSDLNGQYILEGGVMSGTGSQYLTVSWSGTSVQDVAMTISIAPGSTAWTKTLTEGLSGTDTVLKTTQRALSEGLSGTDSVLRSLQRTLSEGMPGTDTFSYVHGYFRTLTEGLSGTDSILRTPGKLLTEGLAGVDSIVRSITHVITEGLSGTDTVNRSTQRSLSEGMPGTDSVTGLRVLARTFTEGLQGLDIIIRTVNNLLKEGMRGTDSVSRSTQRAITEGLAQTDSVSYIHGFYQTLTEGLAGVDSIVRSVSRTLTEGLAGVDSVTRSMSRALSEGLAQTDSVVRAAGKVLTEGLQELDTILRAVTKLLSEGLSGTDSVTPVRGRYATLSEGLAQTDSLSWIFAIILIEGHAFIDSIRRTLNGSSVIWSHSKASAAATWTKTTKSTASVWTKFSKSASALWNHKNVS